MGYGDPRREWPRECRTESRHHVTGDARLVQCEQLFTAALHDLHVTLGNGEVDNLLTTASGTYYSVDDPGVGSALWFEAPGSTDASLMWSGLADTSAALAAVENLSSLLPPDVWYPGI